jgi:hypothetical protein
VALLLTGQLEHNLIFMNLQVTFRFNFFPLHPKSISHLDVQNSSVLDCMDSRDVKRKNTIIVRTVCVDRIIKIEFTMRWAYTTLCIVSLKHASRAICMIYYGIGCLLLTKNRTASESGLSVPIFMYRSDESYEN